MVVFNKTFYAMELEPKTDDEFLNIYIDICNKFQKASTPQEQFGVLYEIKRMFNGSDYYFTRVSSDCVHEEVMVFSYTDLNRYISVKSCGNRVDVQFLV